MSKQLIISLQGNSIEENEMTRILSSNKKLVISSCGIFVCYFYFGILQEKITRSTYGENDRFTFSYTLVFVTCIVNAIFAKIMLHTFMKSGEDSTKQLYHAAVGICYLSAMVSSTMALKHVSYPTQVIGKSCKPIPVMILGVLIGKKRYPLAKYLYVFMIVVGVCLFMYKDKPAGKESEGSSMIGMGELLLLMSLSLDGILGVIQDKMRAEYATKPAHMMFYTNLWSVLILSFVVVLTSEIWSFFQFLEKYPYIAYDILGFSAMSALGQVFIFFVVSEFGPLVCSIITTTRKFFTVLGSVFLFGNALTLQQWLGTSLVFTGLFLDGLYGKKGACTAFTRYCCKLFAVSTICQFVGSGIASSSESASADSQQRICTRIPLDKDSDTIIRRDKTGEKLR